MKIVLLKCPLAIACAIISTAANSTAKPADDAAPVKAPQGITQQKAGLKVKALLVKSDDTKDLLQAYFWRFEINAPSQKNVLMFVLEVRYSDGTRTTVRNLMYSSHDPRANGWPANGRVTVLIGTHPQNDDTSSADNTKYLFRVESFTMPPVKGPPYYPPDIRTPGIETKTDFNPFKNQGVLNRFLSPKPEKDGSFVLFSAKAPQADAAQPASTVSLVFRVKERTDTKGSEQK